MQRHGLYYKLLRTQEHLMKLIECASMDASIVTEEYLKSLDYATNLYEYWRGKLVSSYRQYAVRSLTQPDALKKGVTNACV